MLDRLEELPKAAKVVFQEYPLRSLRQLLQDRQAFHWLAHQCT
jgi:hypothetical protein